MPPKSGLPEWVKTGLVTLVLSIGTAFFVSYLKVETMDVRVSENTQRLKEIDTTIVALKDIAHKMETSDAVQKERLDNIISRLDSLSKGVEKLDNSITSHILERGK